MHSDFQIGNIVLVSARDYIHDGYQGQVVGFDRRDREMPIRVWFGREIDHIHRSRGIGRSFLRELPTKHSIEPPSTSEQARDPRTWNFPRNQLIVCPDWTVKTLAERHYPNYYHSYCEHVDVLFLPGDRDCDVEGCEALTAQRILFNVWGSVFSAKVCDAHAKEYHLKCGDLFPWKKRERVSA